MTRRHVSDDALSRELAALPQPALPRDFAPAVLAQIARMPSRHRRSAGPERTWAPWAIGISALVALSLFAGFSPSGIGRVSGMSVLRVPWTVHVGLALAVGVYVLGLVASLRRRVPESF